MQIEYSRSPTPHAYISNLVAPEFYRQMRFPDIPVRPMGCHRPQLEKQFPFRHNHGVVFLNSNTGFHGPSPIRRVSGLRKWIYYSISSRRNVWQPAPQRPSSRP